MRQTRQHDYRGSNPLIVSKQTLTNRLTPRKIHKSQRKHKGRIDGREFPHRYLVILEMVVHILHSCIQAVHAFNMPFSRQGHVRYSWFAFTEQPGSIATADLVDPDTAKMMEACCSPFSGIRFHLQNVESCINFNSCLSVLHKHPKKFARQQDAETPNQCLDSEVTVATCCSSMKISFIKLAKWTSKWGIFL